MRHVGKEPFPTIYVDAKEEGKTFEVAAKSQLKKIQKIWVRENYKAADKAKVEEETSERRQQNLEEAKKNIIQEDLSLPKAKVVKMYEGELMFLNKIWVSHYMLQPKFTIHFLPYCFNFALISIRSVKTHLSFNYN